MDDERIRQLTQEVLADLSRPAESDAPGVADLEARVAALEAAVRELRETGGVGRRGAAPMVVDSLLVAAAERPAHPSLRLLDLGGGSGRCLMEPDKPCVQSGQCRTLGH